MGDNGQVVVDDLTVCIEREGFKGRHSPPSTVQRDMVKLVEIRPATRLRNGWVRLVYAGQRDKPRFEYQDRDLVLFTWQHREAFARLVELLDN